MRLKEKHLKVAMNVLRYLSFLQGQWTGLWDLYFVNRKDERTYDVAEAMLDYTPRKRLAMMRVLYRNGLVGGCDCGCRGDFEITDKGLEFIGAKRIKEYTGY